MQERNDTVQKKILTPPVKMREIFEQEHGSKKDAEIKQIYEKEFFNPFKSSSNDAGSSAVFLADYLIEYYQIKKTVGFQIPSASALGNNLKGKEVLKKALLSHQQDFEENNFIYFPFPVASSISDHAIAVVFDKNNKKIYCLDSYASKENYSLIKNLMDYCITNLTFLEGFEFIAPKEQKKQQYDMYTCALHTGNNIANIINGIESDKDFKDKFEQDENYLINPNYTSTKDRNYSFYMMALLQNFQNMQVKHQERKQEEILKTQGKKALAEALQSIANILPVTIPITQELYDLIHYLNEEIKKDNHSLREIDVVLSPLECLEVFFQNRNSLLQNVLFSKNIQTFLPKDLNENWEDCAANITKIIQKTMLEQAQVEFEDLLNQEKEIDLLRKELSSLKAISLPKLPNLKDPNFDTSFIEEINATSKTITMLCNRIETIKIFEFQNVNEILSSFTPMLTNLSQELEKKYEEIISASQFLSEMENLNKEIIEDVKKSKVIDTQTFNLLKTKAINARKETSKLEETASKLASEAPETIKIKLLSIRNQAKRIQDQLHQGYLDILTRLKSEINELITTLNNSPQLYKNIDELSKVAEKFTQLLNSMGTISSDYPYNIEELAEINPILLNAKRLLETQYKLLIQDLNTETPLEKIVEEEEKAQQVLQKALSTLPPQFEDSVKNLLNCVEKLFLKKLGYITEKLNQIAPKNEEGEREIKADLFNNLEILQKSINSLQKSLDTIKIYDTTNNSDEIGVYKTFNLAKSKFSESELKDNGQFLANKENNVSRYIKSTQKDLETIIQKLTAELNTLQNTTLRSNGSKDNPSETLPLENNTSKNSPTPLEEAPYKPSNENNYKNQHRADIIGGIVSCLTGASAGALTGAGYGFAIGSGTGTLVLPIIGTLGGGFLGALLGGVIGGILGGLSGLWGWIKLAKHPIHSPVKSSSNQNASLEEIKVTNNPYVKNGMQNTQLTKKTIVVSGSVVSQNVVLQGKKEGDIIENPNPKNSLS